MITIATPPTRSMKKMATTKAVHGISEQRDFNLSMFINDLNIVCHKRFLEFVWKIARDEISPRLSIRFR